MIRPLKHTTAVPVLLLLGLLSAVSAAHAQSRLPVRYAARPLTLSRATLRPDLGLWFTSDGRGPGSRFNTLDLRGGIGIGVTPDLELGSEFLPLRLSPTFDYLNPDVYLRYRFVHGSVEVGAEARLTLPVEGYLAVTGGIPLLIHAGDAVRIDSGMFVDLLFTEPADAEAWIPFVLSVQASSRFFVGVDTGLRVPLRVPLGFFVGYTAGQPSMDVRGGFRLPDVDQGFEVWNLYLALNFYLFV